MTATHTQQDALYTAENGVPHGRRFDSLDDIQAYVDALRDNEWWTRFGYYVVLRIEAGPARKRTKGAMSVGWYEPDKNAGRIEMLPVHWNELMVLHEVAHVIAEACNGSKAHDPWFARVYMNLVYCVMGGAAWEELKAAFDTHGIEYTP
jgi:putative metallohydrolase (TIGR04338 family)